MTSARNGHRDEALRRIAEVRRRFLDGLEKRLEGLSALAAKAGGDEAAIASTARDELRLGLHNLAGSAPTLGLDALGRRASEIERQVIAGRRPDGGLDAGAAPAIGDRIQALRDAVAH